MCEVGHVMDDNWTDCPYCRKTADCYEIITKLDIVPDRSERHYVARNIFTEEVVLVRVLDYANYAEGEHGGVINEAKIFKIHNFYHSNIAVIKDIYIAQHTDLSRLGLFVVYDFHEYSFLSDSQSKYRAFSVEYSLSIARDILKALREAHFRGVVHGQLYTTSILMDANHERYGSALGRACLINFGFSMEYQKTIAMCSKEYYLERGEWLITLERDFRSDICSVGVILFELLTGKPPFQSTGAAYHAPIQIGPPRSINPSVPEHIDRAVMTAIEKNPNERFQSCDDFIRALEGYEAAI